MNIKEMTFEEFLEEGEKETGHKAQGIVKYGVKIMFDNLKNDIWDINDFDDPDMIVSRLKRIINGQA